MPRRSATERKREAQRRMVDLHRDLDDLYVGTGRWTDTPAGRAARTLDDADRRLADVRRAAEEPGALRRDRRAATKAIPQLEAAAEVAQREWEEHGIPEARMLERQVAAARREVVKLTPAADAEHLERIRAHSNERAAGLSQCLGLQPGLRAAGPQTCRRNALPISGSAGLGATGRTLRAPTPAKVITVLFTVR